MFSQFRPVICLLFVLALSACGVTGNLRGDPGYASFESPGLLDTDREFALSLGPFSLRLARAFIDDDEDPEAAALLRNLDAIRLYVYEIENNPERVKARIESTASRLRHDGWESVVAVRDDDELTHVMLRMDGRDRVRGMVVMTQDEGELVLINLIGELRPEMFNHYMSELDIDAPEIEVESG